jgi:hypothetical protein
MRQWNTTLGKEGIQMAAPVVSSMEFLPVVSSANIPPTRTRAYLTKKALGAVHFDEAGKGRIIFLQGGSMLRTMGPSFCLLSGIEVMFEKQIYHVFEIDLITRSTLILGNGVNQAARHASVPVPSG